MLGNNLSYSSVPVQVAAATASGTSTIDTTAVDLAASANSYQSVCFFLKLGTAAAGNKVLPMGSQDGGSTYTQLKDVQVEVANTFKDAAGAAETKISVVPTTDGQVVVVDLVQVAAANSKVRLQIARGTATTISEVWAVLYDATKMPATSGLATHHVAAYLSAHV